MKKTNYNLKRTPSLEARRYDLKRKPGLKIRNVLSVVVLNKKIGEILLSLVQHKKKNKKIRESQKLYNSLSLWRHILSHLNILSSIYAGTRN